MQKKHFNIKDVSKNFKNNLSLLLKYLLFLLVREEKVSPQH